MNSILIFLGKSISLVIKLLNLGNGSTWPGHIALNLNKNFTKDLLQKSDLKIIFVVGTNGKTTTSSLIEHILKTSQKKVILNHSGANLLNGLASTLLLNSTLSGKIKADYVIFEVDENAFPQALKEIHPDYIVILNLFRDQLDRYGEVNTVALKWHKALQNLPVKTNFVLNADDPQIAFLSNELKGQITYFGLNEQNKTQAENDHAADSLFCPNCNAKLSYTHIFYSHLGIWHCPKCKIKRPDNALTKAISYPLSGAYNKYNTHAAVALGKQLNISELILEKALTSFQPAFGRQEVLKIKNKLVKIILAKNPTGFNESLKTIKELKAQNLLLILNDRIADGKDVSWIWDIDIEILSALPDLKLVISGERAYDMGLRVKYAQDTNNKKILVEPDLKIAVEKSLSQTPQNESLYILPTYTAMLQVRKILTGKKIL